MTVKPWAHQNFVFLSVLSGGILLGGAVSFAGLPLWLLVASVSVAIAAVLAQAMSWALASVSTLTILLISLVTVLRLTPLFDVDLALTLTSSLIVVGAAAVAVLAARRKHLRLPSRSTINLMTQALPVPVLAGAVAIVIAVRSGGNRLSWGMNNDAATNTMLARYMWNSGGIDTDVNPNASPLLQALIVANAAPGRASLASAELLGHDLQRNAQLWIVVVLLASVIAALLVVRAARGQSTTVRVAAAAIGGAIPLSWYVTGVSLQFGFMNAPLAVALLCALWVVWTEAPRAPVAALGALALMTTAMLTSWAPLAILPLTLGAGLVLTHRSRLWGESSHAQRVWGLVCGLQMVIYMVIITLPDFLASSAGLGLDGGMANMTPAAIVVASSTTLFVALIGWALQGRGHVLYGAVLLTASSTVAVGYLVYQRRLTESLWGYYPAKFSWFVSILFIIVIVASLASWKVAEPRTRVSSLTMLAAATVAAFGLLAQVPPNGATLDVARAVLDPRSGAPAGSVDEAIVDLIRISDPTSRDLAVRLGPHDRFVNYWLIHMTAPDERHPIRLFGYVGDPGDLDQVCAAIETWGGEVTVHTRDAHLYEELSAVCAADLRIALSP